mmetsp:Transcript_55943/g.109489  ORF Transcript_55943/g.109489 Transcript_55943/m.109489 type:complete len:289 (+) Transcript_55943:632-1498(+)
MNAPDAPHASHISVGVPPVELVPVIQVDGPLERQSRVGAPLENLLCPIHPEEPVHLPFLRHLELGGVPQIVMRLSLLQIFQTVDHVALVLLVKLQRLLGPLRTTLQLVILVVVETEVVGQLSPDDGFFNEGLLALGASRLLPAVGPHGQHRPLHRDLPEVDPGGQVAQRIFVWVVPVCPKDLQPVFAEFVELRHPTGKSRPSPFDLRHSLVDLEFLNGLFQVKRFWLFHRASVRVCLQFGVFCAERGHVFVDLRPDCPRPHLHLLGGVPDGHNVVSIYLDHWHFLRLQ